MSLESIFKKKNPHIYFIGIGGKGLNGMAKLCLERGFKVSGSDIKESDEVKSLLENGVKIFKKQKSQNITEDIDLIVYSSIISENHPERIKARKLKIPEIKRSKLLGFLMKDYLSISIAGSHGKSTTTALAGLCLENSGADPTLIGGAYIKEWDSYERSGKGKYFIAEACEYDRSFHDLASNISIITSIEKSHMEYYKDEAEMVESFRDFVKLHKSGSLIIANGDDTNVRRVIYSGKNRAVTFGFNDSNDYVIKDVSYKLDETLFSVFKDGICVLKDLKIKIPGSYNVLNFTAIIALHHYLGLPISAIENVAKNFKGVGRRFEISMKENMVFVDDFCHHPTQVKNLFDGIKQFFPNHKIYAVFQPRQFHLIKTFLKEYGASFKKADHIIVSDIVPALGDTEKDIRSLKVDDVVKSIRENSFKKSVEYRSQFEDIVENLKKSENKKVVATIGAGDVYKIRDMLIGV